jgi:hypothetical protein
MSLPDWSDRSDEQLATVEIAAANLQLAQELPGAEGLNVDACLDLIDHWTRLVRLGTDRQFVKRKSGADADLSESQYRMLVLVTVLQRNIGVQYYVPFTEGEFDARDSRNLFLHGILLGHGGTCSTMPVLYAAIGRRLGYPLSLVMAKEHLFCRWDDSNGDRFNIEATTWGFSTRTDEEYLEWPKRISASEMQARPYLRSLTRREELAHFIADRGLCLRDHLLLTEAIEAFGHAERLAPADIAMLHERLATMAMACLLDETRDELVFQSDLAALREELRLSGLEQQAYVAARRDLKRIYANRQRRDVETLAAV